MKVKLMKSSFTLRNVKSRAFNQHFYSYLLLVGEEGSASSSQYLASRINSM